jgi:hypothetical protein
MDKDEKIKALEEELELLKQELLETKEHLKKYTAPSRSKNYYETHKEDIIQKTIEYKSSLSPEKKKEYARRAYLKKKEKKDKNQEL